MARHTYSSKPSSDSPDKKETGGDFSWRRGCDSYQLMRSRTSGTVFQTFRAVAHISFFPRFDIPAALIPGLRQPDRQSQTPGCHQLSKIGIPDAHSTNQRRASYRTEYFCRKEYGIYEVTIVTSLTDALKDPLSVGRRSACDDFSVFTSYVRYTCMYACVRSR